MFSKVTHIGPRLHRNGCLPGIVRGARRLPARFAETMPVAMAYDTFAPCLLSLRLLPVIVDPPL
jgi:hypothetical protein